MKQIPRKKWNEYIDKLSLIDETAGQKLRAYITRKGLPETYEATEDLIKYANALVMKYGEASAALACEMYDAISVAEQANVPPAEPAPLPEYSETAKAINGTLKKSDNPDYISGAVERLVKQRGADTMLQNAKRDNAEWAWIPSGDTCSFCLTLASRGWQPASKAVLQGGHAEHIHAHCDCTFAIRHDSSTNVAGYDPEKYREMYEKADGSTPKEKIKNLRRKLDQKNNGKVVVNTDKNDNIKIDLRSRPDRLNNTVIAGIERDIKEGASIDYNPVRKLKEPLSTEDIVSKIAGGDETKGSCGSVAYAYVGNKAGYDVNDFRGGDSRGVFADRFLGAEIAQMKGADGVIVESINDFEAAHHLMDKMQVGHEYILRVAKHASVVRRTESGYEYLELQSKVQNGYKPLNDTALKDRFKCLKTNKVGKTKVKMISSLVDVEKLGKNEDFIDILGYINTSWHQQMRGANGGIK